MNKLTRVWENNADTPLIASNISKTIQNYKEGDLFFIDDEGVFKIRANSKFNMKSINTSAFFEFNKSFITHNSNNYFHPVSNSNIEFRYEGSTYLNKYSASVESNTSNLIENANFLDLTYWNVTQSGTSSANSLVCSETLFENCVYFENDGFGHSVQITQNKTLSTTDNLSVSFYYKSDGALKFELIGNQSITNRWWRDDELIKGWIYTQHFYELESTNGEWKRFELPAINIRESDPLITEVQLKFYSDTMSAKNYITAVQLEKKLYCTTYTANSRGTPSFLLRKETIRMEQGLIEFQMKIQSFNSDYNYFVHADTNENPALRFYLDNQEKKFVFDVFNKQSTSQILEENYCKCEMQLTNEEYNSILNNWIRVILTWDFTVSTKELKIYLKNSIVKSKFEYISSATDFKTYTNNEITKLSFGGIFSGRPDKYISESLFKNLKCNIFSRANQKLLSDLNYDVQPQEDEYFVYEIKNKDEILNINLNASTTYYIWLNIDSTSNDYSNLIVSTSDFSPVVEYDYFSKKIGKFTTDSNKNILRYTIEDYTKEKNTVQLEIVDTLPTSINKNGEMKLLITDTKTVLCVYVDGRGWIEL